MHDIKRGISYAIMASRAKGPKGLMDIIEALGENKGFTFSYRYCVFCGEAYEIR